MKTSFLGILLLINLGLFAQNNVCFTIESNPNSSDPALTVFTKYVDVYGCGIYAESTVPDEKVLHVAAIWAELIDNNEDGIIDDPDLLTELLNNEAIMPIFAQDENASMQTFMNNYNGDGVSAVLWQSEINSSQPGHWGTDATVEEVLHTINGVGHVNLYSAAFNLSPNTSLLTAAMDEARGGQFLSIPSSYPSEAWYHYDDNTCDYQCMAIEYMYWSIVSNMGILNDPSTCSGIANEWEPCSPELFQSTDILMYDLITTPAYKLPQLAPDGNYCPEPVAVSLKNNSSNIEISPNPAQSFLRVKYGKANSTTLKIINNMGQTVYQTVTDSNDMQININKLPNGIYIVKVGNFSKKFIKRR